MARNDTRDERAAIEMLAEGKGGISVHCDSLAEARVEMDREREWLVGLAMAHLGRAEIDFLPEKVCFEGVADRHGEWVLDAKWELW